MDRENRPFGDAGASPSQPPPFPLPPGARARPLTRMEQLHNYIEENDFSPEMLHGRNQYVGDFMEDIQEFCNTLKSLKLQTTKPDEPDELEESHSFSWERMKSYSGDLLKPEKKRWKELPNKLQFDHEAYLLIENAKVLILKIERRVKLLAGETLPDFAPVQRVDIQRDMTNSFGQIDWGTKEAEKTLTEFEETNKALIAKILEEETCLRQRLEMSGVARQTRLQYAQELTTAMKYLAKQLEQKLKFPSVDPGTSALELCMDFFNLPRPTTPDAYHLRQKELEGFVEVQVEQLNKQETPGYNPAMCDIGWTHFTAPLFNISNFEEYFKTSGVGVKPALDVKQRLIDMRDHIKKFPFGVELYTFADNFKVAYNLHSYEQIFGLVDDASALTKMNFMFYTQKLGDKVVLFNALHEGLIVTPEEMIRTAWKKIRALLNREYTPVLKLDEIANEYERTYRRKLFILDWGFEDVGVFASWVQENMADAMGDLELSSENEQAVLKLKPLLGPYTFYDPRSLQKNFLEGAPLEEDDDAEKPKDSNGPSGGGTETVEGKSEHLREPETNDSRVFLEEFNDDYSEDAMFLLL